MRLLSWEESESSEMRGAGDFLWKTGDLACSSCPHQTLPAQEGVGGTRAHLQAKRWRLPGQSRRGDVSFLPPDNVEMLGKCFFSESSLTRFSEDSNLHLERHSYLNNL